MQNARRVSPESGGHGRKNAGPYLNNTILFVIMRPEFYSFAIIQSPEFPCGIRAFLILNIFSFLLLQVIDISQNMVYNGTVETQNVVVGGRHDFKTQNQTEGRNDKD